MPVNETRGKARVIGAALVARPVLHPVIFLVLALIYLWVIQPTRNDWIKIPFLILIVLIPFASNFLHRDRLRDLGLRLDNLWPSVREVGIATVIGAVLVLGIGVLAGTEPVFTRSTLNSLLVYPFWGLIQQYAMQSFSYRRIREGTHRPGAAAALTAILFASIHFPNPALAVMTLVGGYVWCRLFERHPNLFTLALSHGWMAVLLRASWPGDWLHNLRIGPTYWTF